jgi:hypothetical protein
MMHGHHLCNRPAAFAAARHLRASADDKSPLASKRWRRNPTVSSTSGVIAGETEEEVLERHYLESPADRFAGRIYIFSWLER